MAQAGKTCDLSSIDPQTGAPLEIFTASSLASTSLRVPALQEATSNIMDSRKNVSLSQSLIRKEVDSE